MTVRRTGARQIDVIQGRVGIQGRTRLLQVCRFQYRAAAVVMNRSLNPARGRGCFKARSARGAAEEWQWCSMQGGRRIRRRLTVNIMREQRRTRFGSMR